ncbi:tetratricopeptide repeat protein [Pseudoxanthobacter sp. M-2]|uniref:tetratricopeptide repeat protein n=1 Tax=Pseudoxanthobacter sp. M-2 TaxID=3078754 RepID=UPI0038FCEDB5
MFVRFATAALLLVLVAVVAAVGQTSDPASPPGGGVVPRATLDAGPAAPQNGGAPAGGQDTAAPGVPIVDEEALRYFAREGDLDRLEAEIRRLKTLYPSWEPPTDLFDPKAPGPSDVQPLWDLYTAGRYGELRAEISRRQLAEPTWVPPADLLARLKQAEARIRLVNASDSKQWNAVLAIATDDPSVLTCANIDVLWRVAEAFAGSDRMDRARDVYVYILENCTGEKERLATMDKASALLPVDMVTSLFRYARQQEGGGDEFAQIRLNLIRRSVGAANDDPALTVPAEDLAVLDRAAQSGTSPDDAILLGFYAYRHGDPATAIRWFDLALQRGGSVKAAEGYVLSMRAVGRDAEAEPIAYEWRNAGIDNLVTYITLATALLTSETAQVDQTVVDRFAPVVTEERSPLGAQALGWYAYNTGQAPTAVAWFQTSLAWEPSEVAAFGLMLALQRLNDRVGLRQALEIWGARYPRLPQMVLGGGTAALRQQQQAGLTAPAASAAARTVPTTTAVTAATTLSPRATVGTTTAAPASTSAMDLILVETGPATAAPAAGAGAASAAVAAASGAGQYAACVARTDAGMRTGTLTPANALARGWCLMELDRPNEAAAAFDRALTAPPTSETAQQAAYGRSLAYLRLGLTDQAAVSSSRTPLNLTRKHELGAEILIQRALAASRDGRWTEVVLAMTSLAQMRPLTYDLMMLRGYAHYNLGQFEEARQIFDAVKASGVQLEALAAIEVLNERLTKRKF